MKKKKLYTFHFGFLINIAKLQEKETEIFPPIFVSVYD